MSHFFRIASSNLIKALAPASYSSARARRVPKAFGNRYIPARRNLSRFISISIIIAMLSASAPAAPLRLGEISSELRATTAFWLHSSGLARKAQEIFGQQEHPNASQETQHQRDLRVQRIEISPGDIIMLLGEKVAFVATAYDKDGVQVGGVTIKWEANDLGRSRAARISPQGIFEARIPGRVKVSAEGAGKKAQVTVIVSDGILPKRDKTKETTKDVSSHDLPSGVQTHTKVKKSSTTVSPNLMPEPGYGDSNYWSADDPGNQVGDPPGSPDDGGAGNGNFQLAAPVLSLPGRGSSISLDLTYNSRLWNKAGSQITYDIDNDWPAPGWSLGFGKMIGMGVNNGSMIVDPDGTRHPYSGTVYYGYNNSYTIFNGRTTDGKFIDYSHQTGTGGALVWGEARMADGTAIQYGASNQAALYPTRITDANGNFIIITYLNNRGPQIQTITDNLGRSINFSYDANNLLTAITAPAPNGGVRTLVRLHYHLMNLNYGFSGLTVRTRTNTPWVLDAIYYPATGSGFWFNDADSYSSYGMIAKVIEQRGMGFSSSSLNDQGSVSQGAMTQKKVYNYPMSPNYSLTNAPTYTTMTHTWDGMNTAPAVTTYSIQQNATPRRTEVTMPDGTRSVQLSYNTPGQFNDGLVYQEEKFASSGALLSRSTATWAQGDYTAPRPVRTETTDERGQVTATEFEYGPSYNQVTAVREYDFGGTTLLRTKRTEYENGVSYTSRHIFNLVKAIQIDAPNGARVSRTEYQLDGAQLTDTPGVVMHDDASNPYAPQYLVPGYCYWECPDYCYQVCEPDYYTTDYNPSTDFRGNVTQVTSYADATYLSGAVIETRRYDITGNLVLASTSCCEQTSINFTSATQFAYPLSKVRGSASDASSQLTTSNTYDFNTGLPLSATDANGRVSQNTYFADSLRPQTEYMSAGAYKSYSYNDPSRSITETTYLAGGAIAAQSVKRLNGIGKISREEALTDGSQWDVVEIQYDALGRVWQQARPFRNGSESPQWTVITYDDLGRVTRTRAPDGSEMNAYYNEATRPDASNGAPGQTTRMVDAWGRERWERTDATGQLAEVVEPNPTGNGAVANGGLATQYSYNALGKLTQVIQGGQQRSFRYDSLGRMTNQKMAEAAATLNDTGQYVGAGSWSDFFTYDDRSNLVSRTDARGVRMTFSYNNDPLSRVQSVTYDMSGVGGGQAPISPAPSVTYQYMTGGDVKRISRITTDGVSTEDHAYDSEGRVSSKTLTLTSRPSQPMATDYIYDSLNRVTDVRYPAEYGLGAAPRKVVHQGYDVSSRVNRVQVDGADYASQVVYNAMSQITSLKVGAQIDEGYSYNAVTGLLENQTVLRGGATSLLNLSYGYLRPATSSGRTGQLTAIVNNLDRNKDRGYGYDALGRLTQATGGSSTLWTQNYAYDRFGNRTAVTATGNAANTPAPSCSASQTLAIEQFIRNFYQGSLNRQPNTDELQHWGNLLRQAYSQGQKTLLAAAQNFGWALFQSQEYTNRGRSDRDYVYDLYVAYLQRLPDQGGWDYWTSVVPSNGRDNVRRGFDFSTEFANKLGSVCPSASASPIVRDGLSSVSYDATSNRINSPGFSYDAAGNQTRALRADGSWQRFEYDAAGRLVNVKTDSGFTLAAYTYDSANHRLITQDGDTGWSLRNYYVWSGDTIIAEYTEENSTNVPMWKKSYIYFGERLLSSLVRGASTETVQYHHPDRLGTRLVTNATDTSVQEQVSLPFGTALDAESTGAVTRRFTSYERSAMTGLDYAVNRCYDSQQGRFTQVDPIGMRATSLNNPQSLNLFAYVNNDPVNRVDPDGLFSFFKWIGGLFKGIAKAVVNIAKAVIKAVMGFLIHVLDIVGKVLELLHKCNVPDFAGLSQRRQDELRQRGVTPNQWDGLSNKARLGYFNIVAAITAAGLSLMGWVVDWTAGGIRQDRVFFVAGSGSTNLLGQVRVSPNFTQEPAILARLGGHGEYDTSFRQNVFYRSLQMSFTSDGRRLEADLDVFNPLNVAGFFLHNGLEVIPHKINGGKTNPYLVAYRSSWECK